MTPCCIWVSVSFAFDSELVRVCTSVALPGNSIPNTDSLPFASELVKRVECGREAVTAHEFTIGVGTDDVVNVCTSVVFPDCVCDSLPFASEIGSDDAVDVDSLLIFSVFSALDSTNSLRMPSTDAIAVLKMKLIRFRAAEASICVAALASVTMGLTPKSKTLVAFDSLLVNLNDPNPLVFVSSLNTLDDDGAGVVSLLPN